jgi:N2227-like protein.
MFGISSFVRVYGRKTRDEKTSSVHIEKETSYSVPFFYIPPSSSKDGSLPVLDLYKTLDRYKDDADTLISVISMSRDVSKMTEWEIFPDLDNVESDNVNLERLLSFRLGKRIQKTAEVLESDYFALQKILEPFHVSYGLTSAEHDKEWTMFNGIHEEKSSAYDSAFQIITHIVRDWSTEGRNSRNSLYHWCILELLQHGSHGKPVLVPGSGLGRLARDTSLVGFDVEANELSITMSAAAYHFLNGLKTTGKVHPFAFDFLINEVDCAKRFESVHFPDEVDEALVDLVNIENVKRGTLSYTIGDFVEVYSQLAFKAKYGALLTCFFIDTASNIMEYLLTIRNVLVSGGVWVNVGPLQWHQNAKIHPSADELRILIESMGFHITKWTVDKEAVNYRHEDHGGEPRYTKYEGYRPLRFVAMLKTITRQKLEYENAAIKIQKIRRHMIHDKRFSDQYAKKNNNNTSHVTITEIN